jgi:putative ABC transport system substrate-binding protein
LTGLTYFSPELAAKRLDLIKEALPKIRRCSVLANPDNPVNKPTLDAMGQAAAKLGLDLQALEARGADRLPDAFSAMTTARSEGLILIEDGNLIAAAKQLAQLAAKSRIPVVGFTEIADAGGFMAYGVNIPAMFRRAAHYVDRLHKGSKPADLPIERATKFDLIVNMKAAKSLGIRIPEALRVRADRLIE